VRARAFGRRCASTCATTAVACALLACSSAHPAKEVGVGPVDSGADASGGVCTGVDDGGAAPDYNFSLWPAPPDSPPDSQYVISSDGMTVADEITGLVWQQGLYAPCDATSQAYEPCTLEQAQAYCAALNGSALGGCDSGWRLPSFVELMSIVSADGPPYINTHAFPGVMAVGQPMSDGIAPGADFWSSTLVAGSGGASAWYVDFDANALLGGPVIATEGLDAPDGTTQGHFVRCVAGPPTAPAAAAPPARYTVPGDGTVVDNVTQLTWQQAPDAGAVALEQATAACSSLVLAGMSGWRLPTSKELVSVLDFEAPQDEPYPNPTAFPGGAFAIGYWSSTQAAGGTLVCDEGHGREGTVPVMQILAIPPPPAGTGETYEALCVRSAAGGTPCSAGTACTSGSDCCSGTCDPVNEVCDACFADDKACTLDTDCCTGFCAGGAPDPTTCACRPEGYSCTDATTCCSGICFDGQCNESTTCLDIGTENCNQHSASCCAPSTCEVTQQVPFYECCIPAGADCTANSQACCNQMTCENGICT
jgi:Protein of unknown function (DUF1566)